MPLRYHISRTSNQKIKIFLLKKMWMQIPFFCGSSPACWDPGSKWALDQAKTNLVNRYLGKQSRL